MSYNLLSLFSTKLNLLEDALHVRSDVQLAFEKQQSLRHIIRKVVILVSFQIMLSEIPRGPSKTLIISLSMIAKQSHI